MPDKTSRSRSRTTIQRRTRNNTSQNNDRSGNSKRLSIIGAFGTVALVAIAGVIILLTNHNSIPLPGHSTTAPNHTAAGSALETHVSSSDVPQDTMSMMETIMPSDSPTPSDTPASGPMESTQHNDSTTPEPGATGTHDEAVDTSTSATIEIKPIKGKANVTEFLSQRSEASTSASAIAEIPKDSAISILQVDVNPSWLQVEYGDKFGYVLAKYVVVQDNPAYQVCTITSMTVNVRHGAGKDKELIAELHRGDTLVVKEVKITDDGTWYKIAVGDLIGYVSSQYCRLASKG